MRHVSGHVEPHDISIGINTCIQYTRRNALHNFPETLKLQHLLIVLAGLCFTAEIYFLVLGRQ